MNAFFIVSEIILELMVWQHEGEGIVDEFGFGLRQVEFVNRAQYIDADMIFLCGRYDRRKSAIRNPSLDLSIRVELHQKKTHN